MRSLVRRAAKVNEDRKERTEILATTKDAMSNPIWLLGCLLLMLTMNSGPSLAAPFVSEGLLTYPAIPGIVPSDRFSASVRDHDGQARRPLFTMETVGPAKTNSGIHSRGIYESVTGLSASWCTFEMDVPVTVEITKLSPGDIETCVIRPISRQLTPVISDDKRSVSFQIKPRFAEQTTAKSKQVPVNVAVEINGQTDETITVFASPHLTDKPQPDDPGVVQVHPGTQPPVDGDWQTLYFMSGVHDLGKKAHPLRPGKQYYIPGDAWVDGSFGEGFRNRADEAKVFGLGVISGRKIGWYEVEQKTASKPIHLFGADTVLEGLTFIDSPYHTSMGGSKDPKRPTVFRNIKTHNWRTNTDGIHFFGSGIAEDCFIHGQDDSHYIAGSADMVRFRRMVYWRDDTFGVDMIFTAEGGQKTPGNSITEDCDSIYNKSTWGGIIIDQRGIGENRWIDGVGIRDFRIENPGRNKPIIKMYLPEYPCSFKNVLLKNISALTDNGHPFQITGGGPESIIENVTFEDIKLGDRWIEDFSPHNFTLAFVKNLKIIRDGKTVATYSSDIETDAGQIRPDPSNLLKNPGFEIAGFAWNGRQVGAAVVPPQEGRFACQPVDNFNSRNCVSQQVTKEVEKHGGGRYRISAWMRIGSGKGVGEVALRFIQVNRQSGAKYVDAVTIDSVALKADQWVQVAGELVLPWNPEKYDWLRSVHFQAQAQGRFKDLYIDSCRMEAQNEHKVRER